MPKGVPIKDHLADPNFKILYATLKHTDLKNTDFAQVAVDMGCKDATFARNLLNRTMKAQGKGSASSTIKETATTEVKRNIPTKRENGDDKGTDDLGKGSVKKRKISAAMSEVKLKQLDKDDVDDVDKDVKQEAGSGSDCCLSR